MTEIEVVDRGAREIVVFLGGDIDESSTEALNRAVDEVVRLEQLNGLDHAIVDMHKVSALGEAGIAFLRQLQDRGNRNGFQVSFSTMTGPAHRAVEEAGWSFVEHSPPANPTLPQL